MIYKITELILLILVVVALALCLYYRKKENNNTIPASKLLALKKVMFGAMILVFAVGIILIIERIAMFFV